MKNLDNIKECVIPTGTKITGKAWFSHFTKLHNADTGVNTTPHCDTQPRPPCVILNSPFTITELTEEISNMCISSSLTKLLTSMINTRLQKKVDEKGLRSKNQIGFRKQYRAADHLSTLKAVVKKYVTKGANKLDACFVDLKKVRNQGRKQTIRMFCRPKKST